MATNSNTLAQTLAAYVPAFVARQLAADPTSIPVPSVQRAEGVCLFVDIAGFTPLTEELARLGTVAAEKMAGVLNETFRPMLSTCAAQGGEVIDFAGDAIFVIWLAVEGGMDDAALRATQCALALQDLVANRAGPDDQDVSVKITVPGGPLDVLFVGGAGGRVI